MWTTDKDGIIMDLLAAEITATTGRDPGEHYQELAERFGNPAYERMDVPATPEQKHILQKPVAGDGGGERAGRRTRSLPGSLTPRATMPPSAA